MKVQSNVYWLAKYIRLWDAHSSPEVKVPVPSNGKPPLNSIQENGKVCGFPGLRSRDLYHDHAIPQRYLPYTQQLMSRKNHREMAFARF